jgi:hypothetical protein
VGQETQNVHQDLCSGADTNKQDAHNGASKNKFIRITHPHHPLKGKICKVIRNARHTNLAGESWVVDLGNGMRMCVPTESGEIVAGKKVECESAIGDNHNRVAVPDLRKLVTLIEELKAAAQGACDESTYNAGKSNCRAAQMGANTGPETAGNAPDPERDDLPPDEAGEEQ